MKNLLLILIFFSIKINAQILPTILINNLPIKIQGSTSLPFWIGEGKVLALGQDAISASIIEFNINNSNLEFNQVLNITSSGTVPVGKTWKIEAIGIGNNSNYNSISNFSNSTVPSIFNSPVTFSTSGVYNWIVPPGVTSICIEAWGAGGKGGNGSSNNSGGGGGGGGYGYQCFTVTPGQLLLVTVGNSGQNSSVGSLITAFAGTNGGNGTSTNFGAIGQGGSSSASYIVNGENGLSSNSYCSSPASKGGNGGNGGNGGVGAWTTCINGSSSQSSQIGGFPGGGGGGGRASNYSSDLSGANGAAGQVKIYF